MERAYYLVSLNIRFKSFSKCRMLLLVSFSMLRYSHNTPLLFDLHWLPVNQQIVFNILLSVYKVLHQLAPSYLVDAISVMPCSSYSLPAHSNKTLDAGSFSLTAPKLWSNLSFEIRCSNSVVSFKSHFYLRKFFY